MMQRDVWYKHAVIYGIDVERYADGNGDGIGDFAGLANRLDYIAALGVDCLWLLPFYQTPNRDNGYDIVDYYSVDDRLGTLGDFATFMERAEQFGIRVIVDLVVNHTSEEHPWFQSARSSPKSPFRDYYLWSKDKPEVFAPEVMFPGVQKANWTYDEQAKAYYQHKFYQNQPDLNLRNPRVREEIHNVLAFWLRLGVAGFRVDALPHLIELHDETGAVEEEAYWFMDELHEFVQWRSPQAVLLAEANVDPPEIPRYFGEAGNRMQLMFNFIMNQQLVLALVQQRADPITAAFRDTIKPPPMAAWVQFLRNQDELDLRRLSQIERERVFAEWAPDEEMRVYGRGIRRRLASMLEGDRRRIELAYSLLFTLPGVPLLIYGDEIGMGEDLALPERNSVRTVMQWSPTPNGGFSRPGVEPRRPLITEGPFGAQCVNVADQESEAGSLLMWMQRLISAHRRHVEVGAGDYQVLDLGEPTVFASEINAEGNLLITLHNLSEQPVEVTLPEREEGLREVFGNRDYGAPRGRRKALELDPFGYRWLSAEPHHG